MVGKKCSGGNIEIDKFPLLFERVGNELWNIVNVREIGAYKA